MCSPTARHQGTRMMINLHQFIIHTHSTVERTAHSCTRTQQSQSGTLFLSRYLYVCFFRSGELEAPCCPPVFGRCVLYTVQVCLFETVPSTFVAPTVSNTLVSKTSISNTSISNTSVSNTSVSNTSVSQTMRRLGFSLLLSSRMRLTRSSRSTRARCTTCWCGPSRTRRWQTWTG